MKHITLFNLIAKPYALFYKYQHKHYAGILPVLSQLNLESNAKVVDLACGTGALTGLLSEKFRHVDAYDGSAKMLNEARRLHKDQAIEFIEYDLRQELPLKDQSVDLMTTSFFLHGIPKKDRLRVLNEMKRCAKNIVIMDYSRKTNPLIRLVEWVENGDYFYFRKHFLEEFNLVFPVNEVIEFNDHVNFYMVKE